MEKTYIYDYARSIKRNLNRIVNLEDADAEVKKAIEKFVDYLYLQNYSLARVSYYLDKLVRLAPLIKKLSLEEDDLLDFLRIIRNQETLNQTSKEEYTRVYRKLLEFNFKLEQDDKRIKILKIKSRKEYKKIPEDMLSIDEINIIVENAKNFRDKAFIMGLYESGCRIGEILPLKYKDIKFDKYGCLLNIENSKTYARKLRLVFSTPYLARWYDLHPTKEAEDYFWCTLKPLIINAYGQKETKIDYARVGYATFMNMIKGIAKKCNIKKPVNFHNFRKSRATELAKYLSNQLLNKFMGWSRGSRMPLVYVHLNDDSLDNSILQMNGVELEEKIDKKIESKFCSRCHNINEEDSRFCNKCGMPLDKELISDLDELKENILESGLTIKEFAEKNKDAKFPDVVEELVKLNKEVLKKLQEIP
jgi:integrase